LEKVLENILAEVEQTDSEEEDVKFKRLVTRKRKRKTPHSPGMRGAKFGRRKNTVR
jgi:hypothetical protein